MLDSAPDLIILYSLSMLGMLWGISIHAWHLQHLARTIRRLDHTNCTAPIGLLIQGWLIHLDAWIATTGILHPSVPSAFPQHTGHAQCPKEMRSLSEYWITGHCTPSMLAQGSMIPFGARITACENWIIGSFTLLVPSACRECCEGSLYMPSVFKNLWSNVFPLGLAPGLSPWARDLGPY